MAKSTPTVLTTTRDRVGESPVWSVAEQALYWVDIEGQRIHRLDWASRQQSTWNLPERAGCIALSQRGTVIAAMETGIYEVTLQAAPAATLQCLATVQHAQPGMRFNDGRCDAKGRFWVGTMCMDMSLASPAGRIYCLDGQGLHATPLTGYITPNGMAFSPDGTEAYLSDSHPQVQKVWRYRYDAPTGRWSAPQEWVDMQSLPGRPDGAAMDAEGCYWICANDAGMVHRFSHTGRLLQSIDLPVSKPAMCAFGGPALQHLFITSIQPAKPVPGFDTAQDGAVFVLQPGVQGLPEPLFSQFPVP